MQVNFKVEGNLTLAKFSSNQMQWEPTYSFEIDHSKAKTFNDVAQASTI